MSEPSVFSRLYDNVKGFASGIGENAKEMANKAKNMVSPSSTSPLYTPTQPLAASGGKRQTGGSRSRSRRKKSTRSKHQKSRRRQTRRSR